MENAVTEHVQAIIAKLRETGAEIWEDHGLIIKAKEPIRPTDLKTLPFPGFPTDMQPQMMAVLSLADGTSVITETIFDSRLKQLKNWDVWGLVSGLKEELL